MTSRQDKNHPTMSFFGNHENIEIVTLVPPGDRNDEITALRKVLYNRIETGSLTSGRSDAAVLSRGHLLPS